jgi:hypothetical protein
MPAVSHSRVTSVTPVTPLFSTGQLLATPGALAFIATHSINLSELLRRHVSGDDGDLCDDDKEANKFALVHGARIFSSYRFSVPGRAEVGGVQLSQSESDDVNDDRRLWIITEADRHSTTVLLPTEY